MATAPSPGFARAYRPRRPETTALYEVVRDFSARLIEKNLALA